MVSQIIEVEHCGNDHLEPIYSICEIPVPGFPKPQNGGLWTSPVDSENSWRKWCERESYNIGQLQKSFRMEVSTKHLLVINSFDDLLIKLVRPGIMNMDYSTLPVINWKRLVAIYNGIWLTTRGETETRYIRPYNLYGWDCETVFLFNKKPIIQISTNKKRK